MQSIEIDVRTGRDRGFSDLTPACARFAAEASAGGDGLLSVFVPHATAGVVILELGAGSDTDALHTLDRLLPRDDRWTHRHGSHGHGADHVLPLLAAPSITVPVAGRAARARDVAVDRAPRSQRRQRHPPRPAELPGRLRHRDSRGPGGARGSPGPGRSAGRRSGSGEGHRFDELVGDREVAVPGDGEDRVGPRRDRVEPVVVARGHVDRAALSSAQARVRRRSASQAVAVRPSTVELHRRRERSSPRLPANQALDRLGRLEAVGLRPDEASQMSLARLTSSWTVTAHTGRSPTPGTCGRRPIVRLSPAHRSSRTRPASGRSSAG